MKVKFTRDGFYPKMHTRAHMQQAVFNSLSAVTSEEWVERAEWRQAVAHSLAVRSAGAREEGGRAAGHCKPTMGQLAHRGGATEPKAAVGHMACGDRHTTGGRLAAAG